MIKVSETEFLISVFYESREDGGIRVHSPDVPGLALSHPDTDLVLADIVPALEVILSEKIGKSVKVTLPSRLSEIGIQSSVNVLPMKPTGILEYYAKAA